MYIREKVTSVSVAATYLIEAAGKQEANNEEYYHQHGSVYSGFFVSVASLQGCRIESYLIVPIASYRLYLSVHELHLPGGDSWLFPVETFVSCVTVDISSSVPSDSCDGNSLGSAKLGSSAASSVAGLLCSDISRVAAVLWVSHQRHNMASWRHLHHNNATSRDQPFDPLVALLSATLGTNPL